MIKKIAKKLLTMLPQSLKLFLLRERNRIKYCDLFKKTTLHYNSVLSELKKKNGKIRFGSYIVFDSTFGASNIISIMQQKKEMWSYKFVICPDVSRGKENMLRQYKKTKEFFVNKYGAKYVLDGYNILTEEFIDYSKEFDIIYCANPYDAMVNEKHGLKFLSTQNVLPIYISYGCMPDKYGCQDIMPMLEISLFWTVFADTKQSLLDYKKYELIKGKNVQLSGYAKMDDLANIKEESNEKKRIIIAPHHTVVDKKLPLSNFLKYYKLILELPSIYPQIDFIFRPHPLLFVNLVNEGIWTQEQVNNYLIKMNELGITYSQGGDYLSIFKNSDAIIHDCSSFIVEYLFTGHPACFVYRDNSTKKVFSLLGKICLQNYESAYCEDDIIKFINNVLIGKINTKSSTKIEKDIMINYPNVSKWIVSYLEERTK